MPVDHYLDDGMRGYIFNMAKRQLGRIANFDLDDLIQEGYACYYKCRKRYVGEGSVGYSYKLPLRDGGQELKYLPEVPNKLARSHFMRLVKTTLANRYATLAWKQPAGWELNVAALAGADQTADAFWESVLPTEHEVASAATLLTSAPTEIKQLLQLLVNDAVSGFRRFGKKRLAARETTNQYFCRLLKLSPDHNIVKQIEQHFWVDVS